MSLSKAHQSILMERTFFANLLPQSCRGWYSHKFNLSVVRHEVAISEEVPNAVCANSP